MRKLFTRILSLTLLSLSALQANAELKVRDLLGKYTFTATMEQTAAGAASGLECAVNTPVTIQNADYCLAEILGMAGLADAYTPISKISGNELVINNAQGGNYDAWCNAYYSNAEGVNPFYFDPNTGAVNVNYRMTYDPATGNISMPDFTLVDVEDFNAPEAIVLYKFTNVVLQLEEKEKFVIPVINGNWKFNATNSIAGEGGFGNAFDVKLLSTTFHGFDAFSDCNYWTQTRVRNSFYYAPGWSQTNDPKCVVNGNCWTLEFPVSTSDQWQNQCFWNTDIPTNADSKYDFSVRLRSDKAIGNVTVKLYNDDSNFYFADVISLPANEDYLFYKTGLTGIETNALRLVIDFAGNPENTTVVVRDFVFQESGCDGIEAPVIVEEDETIQLKYDTPNNLWKTLVDDLGEDELDVEFWYAPGWGQIDDPDYTIKNGEYTMQYPVATYEQWQCQNKFTARQLSLEAEKKYDFGITLVCNKATKGTIKVADASDDNNNVLLVINNVDLKEGVNEFKSGNLTMSLDGCNETMLILDFGGNPEGLEVTAKNIILQEHADHDYNSEDNLWKATVDDLGEEGFTTTDYYAPGWGGQLQLEKSYADGVHTLSFPQATNQQWQAQYHVIPTAGIAVNASDKYYYSVTIESNVEFYGATLKLTENGNDNNFFPGTDKPQVVKAGTNVYEFGGLSLPMNDAENIKIAFDFGGCADGTVIQISNIILEKMEAEEENPDVDPVITSEEYTATITMPEAAEPIVLKGCVFDGEMLSMPFDKVNIVDDIYLAGTDDDYQLQLNGTIDFKYISETQMSLWSTIYMPHVADPEAEDPYVRAGEENQVVFENYIFDGNLKLDVPEKEVFDFAGTYKPTVSDLFDFTSAYKFPVAVGESADVVVENYEGEFFVTTFFGVDVYYLNYGGIPCKASDDDPRTLEIDNGGLLEYLGEKDGDWIYAAIYAQDVDDKIRLTVEEDGTVTMDNFEIWTYGYNNGRDMDNGYLGTVIVGDVANSIDCMPKANTKSEMAGNGIFSLTGAQQSKLQHGVNIIRHAGKTMKVLVK